jgi:hypothetical protein
MYCGVSKLRLFRVMVFTRTIHYCSLRGTSPARLRRPLPQGESQVRREPTGSWQVGTTLHAANKRCSPTARGVSPKFFQRAHEYQSSIMHHASRASYDYRSRPVNCIPGTLLYEQWQINSRGKPPWRVIMREYIRKGWCDYIRQRKTRQERSPAPSLSPKH